MPDSIARPARPVIGAGLGNLPFALQVFEYKTLTLEQEKLVAASLQGKDTIGILPTGHGKSACYQLPSIVSGDWTIVVSPLIALQRDQVMDLRARGVHAHMLNSDMPDHEKAAVRYFYKSAPANCPAFLYVSPEMLLGDTFHKLFGEATFTRLMVDEAHCVSTWGNSFRPDYGRIKVAARRLGTKICGAYTATADEQILKDIRQRLPLKEDAVMVRANPFRENLNLSFEMPADLAEKRTVRYEKKRNRLFELLVGSYKGPTIIYFSSRSGTETLAAQLREVPELQRNFSIYPYHAEMDPGYRTEVHGHFKNDTRPLIVSTTAFGMGIDRPDIRQVVHYHLPVTLIDYAQQIGRAGRDGQPSLCTTLRFAGEKLLNEGKPVIGTPTISMVEMVYNTLVRVLAKKTAEEAKAYDLSLLRAHLAKRVEGSSGIKGKTAYIDRLNAALVLLMKARVIEEGADGLTVHPFRPGYAVYEYLLEQTKMHERMLYREQERLRDFFGNKSPDQHLLWKLLQSK